MVTIFSWLGISPSRIIKIFKIFFLLLIFMSGIYWLWFWITWHKGYESATHLILSSNTSTDGAKTILLYTPMDGSYGTWRKRFPGPILTCRNPKDGIEHRCRVTSDHNYLSESSAVVVSISDINRFTATWLPLNFQPKPEQKWVAVWGEAPQFFYRATTFPSPRYMSSLNYIFTWTSSFRHDSDYPASYLHRDGNDFCIFKPSKTEKQIESDILSRKSELALWIVSHCPTTSKREKYVDDLRTYMPVNILGTCGEFGEDDAAYRQVEWHKFYLSFENSLCDDYITEKFFIILLDFNTVPVVMGPKKEDYLRVSPPHSFIHVADFENVQKLAEYLIYLDENPEEYLKYFEWKKNYELVCEEPWSCKLCRDIHNSTLMETERLIGDFELMWEETKCYNDLNYTVLSIS